jgi:phage virion morphogenesis protein
MITIKVDDASIKRLFSKLEQKAIDKAQLTRAITGIMKRAVDDNFETQGRPDRWAPLSPVTLKQKLKKGKDKILINSNLLRRSITSYNDANTAVVGTNKPYAAIHQFGGNISRKTKKGSHIITIPARPFLKLTPEDLADIHDFDPTYEEFIVPLTVFLKLLMKKMVVI